MRINSRILLRAIWRAFGQLRCEPLEPDKSFDGVQVSAFKNGARAAASISADFELSWAWRALPSVDCENRARQERANVPLILDILNRAGIPITWATVGHMFLDGCTRGSSGLPHPDMPRPPGTTPWGGDWYAHDPCSSAQAAPGWYAPDLIRLIQASKVGHEIGTHSFSHIDFAAGASSADLVRREIEACIRVMEPFGVKPRSLVFCFNHMGHHHSELLYELGIIAVRHRDERLRLARPQRTSSGIYRLYESMNLRLAEFYSYPEKARVFIDEAIRHRTTYHLWFHPSDEPRVFLEAFAPIVEYLAAMQRSNQIWVATMSQLASYREAREKMRIRTKTTPNRQLLLLECPLNSERFGDPEVSLVVPRSTPPRSVSASLNGSQQSLPLTFRYDHVTRCVTFNVRSTVSSVCIE